MVILNHQRVPNLRPARSSGWWVFVVIAGSIFHRRSHNGSTHNHHPTATPSITIFTDFPSLNAIGYIYIYVHLHMCVCIWNSPWLGGLSSVIDHPKIDGSFLIVLIFVLPCCAPPRPAHMVGGRTGALGLQRGSPHWRCCGSVLLHPLMSSGYIHPLPDKISAAVPGRALMRGSWTMQA